MSRAGGWGGRWIFAPVVVAGLAMAGPVAQAAEDFTLPEIRTTASNRVPACATPDRLMAFVAARNLKLPPKFSNIAAIYRELGEGARVRWDYAFFQMILETNYLMYRRGDGSSGDVGQAQNNFAGIGATGGGVPGDKYGDVRTGVLAHIQHLTAYSGERVERPVAARTRAYQNDIIEISRKLGRRVTFADLSRRWAVDRAYGRNIETVAQMFARNHCSTTAAAVPAAPAATNPRTAFARPSRLGATGLEPPAGDPKAAATGGSGLVQTVWRRGDPVPPAPQPVAPRSKADVFAQIDEVAPIVAAPDVTAPAHAAGAEHKGAARFAMAAEAGVAIGRLPAPVNCRIYSASYGGTESVLIRARSGSEVRLTAVTVVADERRSMAENFIATHAPGGEVVGHYDSKAAAVSAAKGMCAAN
ncbi:MAG: glucosaminidase domain-containing protein [Hyphomicrobiaceae bacterium]